ncbi:MAG: hypothetical protein KAR24_01335 [Candidatus Pacebacteria bacterium]|nr:hypothetical protein [Candidatus Paceibacterota bacterium]
MSFEGVPEQKENNFASFEKAIKMETPDGQEKILTYIASQTALESARN